MASHFRRLATLAKELPRAAAYATESVHARSNANLPVKPSASKATDMPVVDTQQATLPHQKAPDAAAQFTTKSFLSNLQHKLASELSPSGLPHLEPSTAKVPALDPQIIAAFLQHIASEDPHAGIPFSAGTTELTPKQEQEFQQAMLRSIADQEDPFTGISEASETFTHEIFSQWMAESPVGKAITEGIQSILESPTLKEFMVSAGTTVAMHAPSAALGVAQAAGTMPSFARFTLKGVEVNAVRSGIKWGVQSAISESIQKALTPEGAAKDPEIKKHADLAAAFCTSIIFCPLENIRQAQIASREPVSVGTAAMRMVQQDVTRPFRGATPAVMLQLIGTLTRLMMKPDASGKAPSEAEKNAVMVAAGVFSGVVGMTKNISQTNGVSPTEAFKSVLKTAAKQPRTAALLMGFSVALNVIGTRLYGLMDQGYDSATSHAGKAHATT